MNIRFSLVRTSHRRSYFQTVTSPQNSAFVNMLTSRLGSNVRITDPMNSAYEMVIFWEMAIRQLISTRLPQGFSIEADGVDSLNLTQLAQNSTLIKQHIYNLQFQAPEGPAFCFSA